jgi:hypothetical protein
MWPAMGERDSNNRNLVGPDGKPRSYAELLEMADPSVADAVKPEEQAVRHTRCQEDIAEVGRRLRETDLDAIIMLADDERSMFNDEHWPAMFLYYGETVPYVGRRVEENAPPQARATAWAYGTESLDLPGAPDLGEQILKHFASEDIFISRSKTLGEGKGIGHHLGFMNTRLLDNKRVPIIPMVVNGSYPPNAPSPSFCYRVGAAMKGAIDGWDRDAKVGIVTVGGFSHPVIDEETDRKILKAVQENDKVAIASIPADRLVGGNGQERIWFIAAGALQDLDMHLIDYIPAYRSAGGTGCGMAFAYWD